MWWKKRNKKASNLCCSLRIGTSIICNARVVAKTMTTQKNKKKKEKKILYCFLSKTFDGNSTDKSFFHMCYNSTTSQGCFDKCVQLCMIFITLFSPINNNQCWRRLSCYSLVIIRLRKNNQWWNYFYYQNHFLPRR